MAQKTALQDLPSQRCLQTLQINNKEGLSMTHSNRRQYKHMWLYNKYISGIHNSHQSPRIRMLSKGWTGKFSRSSVTVWSYRMALFAQHPGTVLTRRRRSGRLLSNLVRPKAKETSC